MKSIKAMLNNAVLVSLVVLVSADFYSSKYDDFDVQPLVDNDRVLLGYTKCFLDQGPCTPDAKDFKSKFQLCKALKVGFLLYFYSLFRFYGPQLPYKNIVNVTNEE